MATFEQMVQHPERIDSADMPFRLLEVRGTHSWMTPRSVELDDHDWSGDESGKLILQVKQGFKVQMMISTQAYFFQLDDHFDEGDLAAWDIELHQPVWPEDESDFNGSQSMSLTLYPLSVIAIDVDGFNFNPFWNRGHNKTDRSIEAGDGFELIDLNPFGDDNPDSGRIANIGAGHLRYKNGLWLALTYPYGNPNSNDVKYFRMDDFDDETMITLLRTYNFTALNLNEESGGGTTQDYYTTGGGGDSPIQLSEDWERLALVGQGTDANGVPWRVTIGVIEATDEYGVFVDGYMVYGPIIDGFNGQDAYQMCLDQAYIEIDIRKKQGEETDPKITEDEWGWLALLGVPILAVGLVLGLFLLSRGK